MTYFHKNYNMSKVPMKTMRTLIALVTMLVIGASTSELFGKGTPWTMQFDQDADGDGGVIVVSITADNGGFDLFTAQIAPNATREDKAKAIADWINNVGFTFEARIDPSDATKVIVEVRDDWDDDNEIKEIEFIDIETGEKLHRSKDDPNDITVDIKVDISGSGVNRYDGGTAEAALGIGDAGPLASVETLGKTGEQIESELAEAFNALYSPDYAAVIKDEALVVADVPCEDGTVFGTDDNGLTYGHTMTRTNWPKPIIPTVSEWGLIVMTLLLLTAGAIVIWRRQRTAV
jgi:hypothetical protein